MKFLIQSWALRVLRRVMRKYKRCLHCSLKSKCQGDFLVIERKY